MASTFNSVDTYFRPGRSLFVAGLVVFATILVNALLIIIDIYLDPQVGGSAVIPIGSLAVGGVIAWLLNGLLLQAAATLLDGSGNFRDALVVSAWGLPPTVIVWLTSLVVTIYRVVALPPSEVGGSILSPLVIIGTVAALLGTWYIWMVGLQGTHELERRSAAIAAGAVVILLGGLVFFN